MSVLIDTNVLLRSVPPSHPMHDALDRRSDTYEEFASILIESTDVYTEWKRLVVAHRVTGVQAHDARLLAAMNVYGVRRVVTFNTQDFDRYEGIEAIRLV